MNRAPSEARITTASAISATSPRRPSGVSPMTSPRLPPRWATAPAWPCPGRAARPSPSAPGRGHRGYVDDRAARARQPAGTHRAQSVLAAQRGAQHVGVEHPAGVVRAEVHQQAGDLCPGVVHQDVQAARVAGGLRESLLTYCVRQYKAECVTRYDNIVAIAGSGSTTAAPPGRCAADVTSRNSRTHPQGTMAARAGDGRVGEAQGSRGWQPRQA